MIRINLLGEKKDNTAIHVLQLLAFGVSILFILGTAFVLKSGITSQLDFAKTEQQLLNGRLAKLKQKTKKVDELEKKKRFLSEKLTTIAQLKARRQGPVQLLDNITGSIPARAWLTEVAQNGQDVEFTGLAVDPQTVSIFMRALQNSIFFSAVDLGYSRQFIRNDVKLQQFSVVGKLLDALDLQEKLANRDAKGSEGEAGEESAEAEEAAALEKKN